MKNCQLILVTVLGFLWGSQSLAQEDCTTYVGGNFIGDGEWTAAGSPYCILLDDLVVEAGVVLTIGPGVEVVSLGGEIRVYGVLQAIGSLEMPIVFRGYEDAGWDGITFDDMREPGSELAFVKVTGARRSAVTLDEEPTNYPIPPFVPVIRDCEIVDNTVTFSFDERGVQTSYRLTRHGGGGLLVKIPGWGELAPVVVERCLIARNSSVSSTNETHSGGAFRTRGGGVAVEAGTLILNDSVIADNWVETTLDPGTGVGSNEGVGGGLYAIDVVLNRTRVERNSVRAGGNDATALGGGVYAIRARVNDSVLNGNWTAAEASSGTPTRSGGGLYHRFSATSVLNSTVYGNVADAGGGVFTHPDGAATITNSVVWNNGTEIGGPGTNTVSYSLVQGGFAGVGNISANPMFLDPVNDPKLHVRPGSPVIDSADCGAAPALDIDGEPRPFGAGCDMGADELTAHFADVPTDYWAFDWIEAMFRAGITSGCASDLYCPEDTITRAQMAVFLLRAKYGGDYQPPPADDPPMFQDVPADQWAASWIEQLAREDITGGCGGGNYCPDDQLTRAQMAVFLLRAKYGGVYQPPPADDPPMFQDVPSDYWSVAWIEQLAREGVTSGCGGGNYCPGDPATRAQMAVFVVKMFVFGEWARLRWLSTAGQ